MKGDHVVHTLTGPGVFTEGIENYLKEHNKPTFIDKKKYYNYTDKKTLCVFNYNVFHKKMVKHLFTGQDSDGWFQDRKKILMN
jgi:hypothetical protein